MIIYLGLLLPFIISAGFSLLVVMSKSRHIRWTGDAKLDEPQKIHQEVVPRVGGVGVVLALFTSIAWYGSQGIVGEPLLLGLALLPCFMAGLAEDITNTVSPRIRYLMTMASALLLCFLQHAWITSIAIDWVDQLFTISMISIVFTLFLLSSIAHSFNLIDGHNGLCAGVTVLASVAIAQVAHLEAEQGIALLALGLAAANIGFLFLNYPFGRIFLGDAGAYVNGLFVGFLMVYLVASAESVSPWFAVSVLVYPAWETVFSMLRRAIAGQPFSEPDNQHLHSLMHHVGRRTQNILQHSPAPILWCMQALISQVAVAWYEHTIVQVLLSAAFIVCYLVAYRLFSRWSPQASHAG